MTAATWRRRLAVPAALAILAATYWSLFYDRDGVLQDEGVFNHPPQRILRGEFPHVDYVIHYSGALDLYTAGLFLLFGEDMRVPRVAVGLAGILVVLSIYASGHRMMPRPWAAGAALLFIVWGPPIAFSASPAWYASFLTVGSMAALVQSSQRRRRFWLFAAGVLVGLAFIVRQNSGLYALAAAFAAVALATPAGEAATSFSFATTRWTRSAFWLAFAAAPFVLIGSRLELAWLFPTCLPMVGVAALALRHLTRENRASTLPLKALSLDYGWLSLGFSAVLGVWLSAFLARGALADWYRESFPEASAMGGWNYAPPPPLSAGGWTILLTTGAIIGAIVYGVRAGRPSWHSAALVGAIGLAGLAWLGGTEEAGGFTAQAFQGVWDLMYRWPPLLTALGLGLAWPRSESSAGNGLRRANVSGMEPPALVLLAYVGTSGLYLYPDTFPLYLAHISGFIALGGAYMLSRASGAIVRCGPGSVLSHASRIVVIGALPIVLGAFAVMMKLADRSQEYVRAEPSRGNVYFKAREAVPLVQTIEFLREHTLPEEPILAYSSMNIINFLLDRPNPTAYVGYLDVSLRVLGVSRSSLLDTVWCRGTRYVVIYPSKGDLVPDRTEFRSLVEQRMGLVASFGSVDIYHRDEPAQEPACAEQSDRARAPPRKDPLLSAG